MSRSLRLLLVFGAAGIFAATGSGQRQFPEFPPDIFDNRAVDVVRIAPDRYTVEMIADVRVLRARLPGGARVPIHNHRSGVLVALSEVHLRFTRPDGTAQEIHLAPGATQWLAGESHAETNLGAETCEFVFVEAAR